MRDRPDSRITRRISSSVASTGRATTSVRWVMTSKAVWLLNSKTLSIISPLGLGDGALFLGDVRAHADVFLGDFLGLGVGVDAQQAQHAVGRHRQQPYDGPGEVAKPKITPLTARATASVFCMATRLGTSSPKTREK